MAKARGDFVDILIRNGTVGPDQLEEAERLAASTGTKLQESLIKLNYATQNEVMSAVAEFHNLQFVNLEEVEIPKAVIELVPESVARENVVLPLSLEGNVLKIITADPTNYDTIQKLQFILNKDVVPVLAIQEQITEAINRNYGQTETESVDSMLVERDKAPRRLLAPLLARLKIMGPIDISEKRRPQDGRIKMTVHGKHFDLRVSMLPSVHGQSVVMRILDRGNIQVNIRDLGFSEDDYIRFQNIIKRPNGIFLVTGPTGSGKTTTLYAALNELNRPDRKIITAEDPVEYYLPGVNQVEVKHNIGLDFARIIRAMLRQAPNIILVGEMRDYETASMGIQASLTGHLVFSTLHTNDAPGAVTRMIDMGVPAYLVAGSVIAILAQRLVRLICQRCRQPIQLPENVLRDAGISPELTA